MRTLKFLSLVLLIGSVHAQRSHPVKISWAPQMTSGATEGLYIHSDPPTELYVRIEATADGVALPTVEGHVDDVDWHIDAPIRNLDTYRLVRLTITIGGKEWVFDDPPQELLLKGVS
jgi:hypothetical protein